MKPEFKRLATALTALLAVSVSAKAQDVSTSLPLTSVGDKLLWTVGDQELTLDVPLGGRVRLELYSPRVDQSDYRSDDYYGDEQYDANQSQVTTTFTLLNEDGREVLSQVFTPGAHDWETLFDQDMPAGRYHLKAVTQGSGKNTFAIRLAGVSAEVHAERISVNVHSRDWVPAVNVRTDGSGYVLRLYDGDGPQELEARLRDAQGRVYPLPVSADLEFIDLPLPEQAGSYTVELRQPSPAKQFSNTVGFRLARRDQVEPITVARVDQTGTLRVTAELVLPGGTQPTQASVTVGTTPLNVDGQLRRPVPAAKYAVTAAPIQGADVQVDTSSVTVPRGGVGEVHVQVRPQVQLAVQSDKPQVCVGDTVTLTARATTAFQGELPLDMILDVLGTGGLRVEGQNDLQGTLSAARPGEIRLTGTATQPGPLTVRAKLAPWSQEQTLHLNVLPDATSLQLSRAALADAQVGAEITVNLTVKNTAAQPVPYHLTDTPDKGLQALEPSTFSGTLQPGETKTLSYRALVKDAGQHDLKAELLAAGCEAVQTSAAQLMALAPEPAPAPAPEPTPTPQPEPKPAPVQTRLSTVTLPFDAPAQARELVVAQALPAGATLVPGSSKLGGQPIADPQRGPSGTLYWVIADPLKGSAAGAAIRGQITYDLTHQDALGELPRPALLAYFKGERSEVLEGQLNLEDFKAATALGVQPQGSENPGQIKLPLAGSDIRVRDRISIVVEAPTGEQPTLLVNGEPVGDDRIGESVQDGPRGVQRLTYVGVPLRSGPNTIQYGTDTITVYRVGPTARIEVSPAQLIADGSTPLRVQIRTTDANGRPSEPGTVTLRSNLEVRTPDADPSQAGYQVRIQNGQGVLELQPQASPTTLKIDVLDGETVKTHTFEVKPDQGRVGVGMVSATVGLDGNFNLQDDLTWQARASYEGPLAGGKLYVAADKDGLPTDRDTLKRFSILGDSSVETVPLQGIDPVAIAYDHPAFHAQYSQTSLPIDVLPVGEQLTALTVSSKTQPQVSGFVAMVPSDRISGERVTPEGTRILRLAHGDLAPGSETLEVVTYERLPGTSTLTGKELSRVTLIRNVDYQLDGRTGIITLSRALDRYDAGLNEVAVLASYRVSNPLGNRQLAYGAQVKYTTQQYGVGVAAISMDGTVTYGARATYNNGTIRADGLLAYSGGVQASADLGVKLGSGTIQARVRYQDEGYQGLAPLADGLSASATYDARITTRLSASVQGEYQRTTSTEGGSVTARADYRIAPFSVGAGIKYAFGDEYGLGAVLSAGYHQQPLDIDVVHTQPLSGNLAPTTAITTRYTFSNDLSLALTDQINWKTGHTATLSLNSRLGNTNYQLAYDLPNSGGQGNRARFGVTTSLPLTERLTAGLRGNATYDLNTQDPNLGAGVDLNYKTDTVAATAGTDVTYSPSQGFGVVVRGGISGSLNDKLTLSADGLIEFGTGKSGQRAALGFAYRDRNFNALGTARYVNGSLAGGQSEFSTNLAAEYRQSNWAVRGGLDTRTLLQDPSSFTLQAGLSGQLYLTDYFGVGAWGHMLTQPATQTTQYGFGLEASLRALPGTWLTAGYNPVGFTGIGNNYTKQGFYLRLDMMLNETLGGQK